MHLGLLDFLVFSGNAYIVVPQGRPGNDVGVHTVIALLIDTVAFRSTLLHHRPAQERAVMKELLLQSDKTIAENSSPFETSGTAQKIQLQ